MANVNPVDGIVYGFRLLGYLLVVFLAGGLITFIGADSGDTAGAFITFLGSLIILAGFLGIQFKLISDGVERGIRASQGTAPEGEGLSGLPFIGDAVGGQGRRRQRGQQNRQQRGQQNQRQRGEQRSRQNREQRGQQQQGQRDRRQGGQQQGEQRRQRRDEQGQDRTEG